MQLYNLEDTVCDIILYPPSFLLEIRVIIKISSHPWYLINCDWFELGWSKKIQNNQLKKAGIFNCAKILNMFRESKLKECEHNYIHKSSWIHISSLIEMFYCTSRTKKKLAFSHCAMMHYQQFKYVKNWQQFLYTGDSSLWGVTVEELFAYIFEST